MTSAESESSSAESMPSSSGTKTPSSASAPGKKVVIKAGAPKSFPDKVGDWMKAAGSGPATIYNKGAASVTLGFTAGTDFKTISVAVTDEKTPVPAGLCGRTSTAGNYVCYLETQDGVINVSADDLAPMVAFANDLTTSLGTG